MSGHVRHNSLVMNSMCIGSLWLWLCNGVCRMKTGKPDLQYMQCMHADGMCVCVYPQLIIQYVNIAMQARVHADMPRVCASVYIVYTLLLCCEEHATGQNSTLIMHTKCILYFSFARAPQTFHRTPSCRTRRTYTHINNGFKSNASMKNVCKYSGIRSL